MGKAKWDGRVHSVESCIEDIIRRNAHTSELEGGGTQRITPRDDGTLHVDWYGPSGSAKGHWHFVFEIDQDGRAVNGRLAHR